MTPNYPNMHTRTIVFSLILTTALLGLSPADASGPNVYKAGTGSAKDGSSAADGDSGNLIICARPGAVIEFDWVVDDKRPITLGVTRKAEFSAIVHALTGEEVGRDVRHISWVKTPFMASSAGATPLRVAIPPADVGGLWQAQLNVRSWDDAFAQEPTSVSLKTINLQNLCEIPDDLGECLNSGVDNAARGSASTGLSGTADIKVGAIIKTQCFEVGLPLAFVGETTGDLGDPLSFTFDSWCEHQSEGMFDYLAVTLWNMDVVDVSYSGRVPVLTNIAQLTIDFDMPGTGIGGRKSAEVMTQEGCYAAQQGLEAEARAEGYAYASSVLSAIPVSIHGDLAVIQTSTGWLYNLEGDGLAKVTYEAKLADAVANAVATKWAFDAQFEAIEVTPCGGSGPCVVGVVNSHGESLLTA